MSERLAGKVAIITGASSGIGAACVERFIEEGASVMAVGRNLSQLKEVSASSGGEASSRVKVFQANVSDEAAVKAMVEATLEAFEQLDILVNNAGVASGADVLSFTGEEFDRVINTNLRGPLLCCKYAIPEMLKGGGGAIVNVSSISASSGVPGQAVYSPSKAGLVQLSRQLAIEFASKNIRVNSVSPGTIETPMIEAMVKDPARRYKYDYFLTRHPLGRFGRAIEVANAILFMASDEASFITGANLAVDGGFTAQ